MVCDRRAEEPAGVGGEALQPGGVRRVGGEVALGVADHPGLERGVEGDLLAGPDDQLGRAAADVDDQSRAGRGPFGGRAPVGEVRLLVAVEDLGRKVEALAQLGDEGAAVGGVADGARRDRRDRPRSQLLVARDVVGDRLADVLDRLHRELPGEVDAASQPRHPGPPVDLRDAGAADVGHQQPGRVCSDVDDGDSCCLVSQESHSS